MRYADRVFGDDCFANHASMTCDSAPDNLSAGVFSMALMMPAHASYVNIIAVDTQHNQEYYVECSFEGTQSKIRR